MVDSEKGYGHYKLTITFFVLFVVMQSTHHRNSVLFNRLNNTFLLS